MHEDEHSDSEKDAFAVAWNTERFTLREHAVFTEAVPAVIDGIHDTGELFFKVWVTHRKASEFDQCLRCGAARPVLSEPSET